MRVVEWKEMELAGGLLLVGMPSFGVVGSVAANYLIESLGLELVGAFQGDELPPAAVVHDGVALGMLQVYASEVACGPDGACDRLILVKGDLPVPPNQYSAVAAGLLDWADERAIPWVVSLEGTTSPGMRERVRGMASLAGRDLLDRYDIDALSGAIFSGFSASLLLHANARGMKALALLTAASEEVPDARAAARLLEAVNPMLPAINLEPEHLQKRAAELEARFAEVRREHDEGVKKLMAETSPMYM